MDIAQNGCLAASAVTLIAAIVFVGIAPKQQSVLGFTGGFGSSSVVRHSALY